MIERRGALGVCLFFNLIICEHRLSKETEMDNVYMLNIEEEKALSLKRTYAQ